MQRILKYGVPSLSFFGYYFCFTLIFTFVPLKLNSLHISQELIGTLMAVNPLMLLVVCVPFGMISDRVPPKFAASAGLLILSGSIFAIRHCITFWPFFAAFAGVGVGVALFTVSASSLYFKSLGAARQGIKLAFFNSLMHVGYGLGPMAGSLIYGAGGTLDTLFVFSAAMLLPFSALMLAAPNVKVERFPPSYYIDDLRDRRKWLVFAITFIFCLHFGAENVCYSLFLKYNCHVHESQIGIVFLFVGLGIIPAAIITGLLADRTRRTDALLAVGALLSGLFNFLMLFAHSLWPVVLMRMCHAVGDGIFLVYLDIVVSRMFPPKRIGAPIGMRDMIKTAGTITGAILAGFLPGYAMPFAVTGLAAMLLAPFVFRYFRSA